MCFEFRFIIDYLLKYTLEFELKLAFIYTVYVMLCRKKITKRNEVNMSVFYLLKYSICKSNQVSTTIATFAHFSTHATFSIFIDLLRQIKGEHLLSLCFCTYITKILSFDYFYY